jgi:preprotein translocase subunit SecG
LLDGAYEIVSVDSATQLTISVLRPDSEAPAIAPPAATGISYRISTFGPQANEVGFQLTEYFGIAPGNPASDIGVEDVLDVSVLRLASVFAVISIAYAMLAGKARDENYWKKSLHYQKLFDKARGRCRLSIDIGSDGVVDVTKVGAAGRLVRD